jgi:hypothetical protein
LQIKPGLVITHASTTDVPEAPFVQAANPFSVMVPKALGETVIPQFAVSGVTV